jgi:hypothetical protein
MSACLGSNPTVECGASWPAGVGATDAFTEVRFLALTARSWGQSRRPASGRFDPFANAPGNDRYLRRPVIADRSGGRNTASSADRRMTAVSRSLLTTFCA